MTIDELVDRAQRLASAAASQTRPILGITGPPGAGKSTLAATLAAALGSRVALAPMDGFHLANEILSRLGRRERKGAPDTFDVDGYRALLKRARSRNETVYAPRFDRDLEESIGSALPIPPEVDLVITEGNYLLYGEEWAPVRPLLDEVWHLSIPREEARQRLVARRLGHGHAEIPAITWVESVDLPNYDLVEAGKSRADLIVEYQR